MEVDECIHLLAMHHNPHAVYTRASPGSVQTDYTAVMRAIMIKAATIPVGVALNVGVTSELDSAPHRSIFSGVGTAKDISAVRDVFKLS